MFNTDLSDVKPFLTESILFLHATNDNTHRSPLSFSEESQVMKIPVKLLTSFDGVLGVAFVSNSPVVTDPGTTNFPLKVSCSI